MKVVKIIILLFTTLWAGCSSKTTVETSSNYEQIILPDNSIVLLNTNSSVSYERNFNPRNINLKGEAFFNVSDGKSPFVVQTNYGAITVLGTEFNINASKENLEVEVEHGRVELEKAGNKLKKQIKKGERVVLKSTDEVIKATKAEFKHKIWINSLEKEFKKLGKEVKVIRKKAKKEIKSTGKTIEKKSKELGKEIKKQSN